MNFLFDVFWIEIAGDEKIEIAQWGETSKSNEHNMLNVNNLLYYSVYGT